MPCSWVWGDWWFFGDIATELRSRDRAEFQVEIDLDKMLRVWTYPSLGALSLQSAWTLCYGPRHFDMDPDRNTSVQSDLLITRFKHKAESFLVYLGETSEQVRKFWHYLGETSEGVRHFPRLEEQSSFSLRCLRSEPKLTLELTLFWNSASLSNLATTTSVCLGFRESFLGSRLDLV
jgi:hypothetical protein